MEGLKLRNHIIFFSGGKASFAVADWVITEFPYDNTILYFTDPSWEHKDSYRFIDECSDKLKLPLLTHSAGLNPLQLMFEKKLLYNSMIGDCSKLLKIKVGEDFLKRGIKPKIEQWRNKEYLKQEDFITGATLYFGIGFDEMHRQVPIIENWKPFVVEMPLIENNIWIDEVLKKYDIKQPELYNLGFSHNNCSARCVKAGQGHYKLFKERLPAEFNKYMEQEYHLKMCVSAYRYLTKTFDKVDGIKVPLPEDDIIPAHVQEAELAILDDAYRDYFYDRADKPKFYIHPAGSAIAKYMHIQQYSFMKKDGKPYPIRELNSEIENNQQIDIGGCGCFTDYGCKIVREV
jgi:hypothetical protein